MRWRDRPHHDPGAWSRANASKTYRAMEEIPMICRTLRRNAPCLWHQGFGLAATRSDHSRDCCRIGRGWETHSPTPAPTGCRGGEPEWDRLVAQPAARTFAPSARERKYAKKDKASEPAATAAPVRR